MNSEANRIRLDRVPDCDCARASAGALVELAPQPPVTVDYSGTLRRDLYVPEEIVTYGGEVLNEAGLIELVDPQDQEFTRHTLTWAKTQEGASGRLRLRMRKSTGGWLPVSAIVGRHGGKVVMSVATDDAEALRRAEAKLRQIVEGARQAATVTVDGRVVYANPALATLLGYDSLEQMRRDATEANHVHPDDQATVAQYQNDRVEGRETPESYEFRMVRTDGRVIWVESFTSTINWGGRTASLAWLADVTARMNAIEALRRSEELFTVLFRVCPEMMVLSRRDDGKIVDVNDRFLKVTGHERDQVIGRTGMELNLLANDNDVRQFVLLADDDRRNRELDTTINLLDGSQREIAVSARDIRFAGDDLILYVARDVTARRREEQLLVESKRAAELANRSKSEFLANMSHELRTPLNAVIGFSEIIAGEHFGPVGTQRYQTYAQDIHDSGKHLLQIINDLLDLSKLEAGKQELHPEPVDLQAVIRDCVRVVSHRALEAGVKVIDQAAAMEPAICRADERLLKQILFNLLSNAIKFTPNGGEIRVCLEFAEDGGAVIQVADTGVGMTRAEQETAMSPFGQVAGSISKQHQGTGLGLPIVKSLVELHGGVFDLTSERGDGTTATIRLPATDGM